MHNLKKKISVILVYMMCFSIIAPSLAFDLELTYDGQTYKYGDAIKIPGGESISVRAIASGDTTNFEVTSGDSTNFEITSGDTTSFEWAFVDSDNTRYNIASTGDQITYKLPVNETTEKVIGKIEAKNSEETKTLEIEIQPEAAPEEPLEVGAIRISADKYKLDVNESTNLNAEVYSTTGELMSGEKVNWYVADDTIASVDKSGKVVALKEGLAELSAKLATNENIASSSITIAVGQDLPLKLISTYPVNESRHFNVNEEVILTFNQPVEVNPPTEGMPAIFVYYDKSYKGMNGCNEDLFKNEKYASSEFVISDKNPNQVIIRFLDVEGNKISLLQNHTFNIMMFDGTFKAKSNDSGSPFIMFNFDTTPEDEAFKAVKLSIKNPGVKETVKDQTLQLEAEVKDKYDQIIPDYKVIWSVGDTDMATIDENGLLTSKGYGNYKVYASLSEESENKAELRLKGLINFDKQMTRIWAYKPQDRIQYVGQAIAAKDGSAYCAWKKFNADENYKILGFNADGSRKENFNEAETEGAFNLGVIDGKEYLVARVGNEITLVNPENGLIEWKAGIKYNFTTTPFINSEGTIIVGAEDYKLYAFEKGQDTYKWRYDLEGEMKGPSDSSNENMTDIPCIDKDQNIYVLANDKVISLDKDGNERWKFIDPDGDDFWYQVVTDSEGNAYIVSPDTKVYCINPAGEIVWQKKFNNINKRLMMIGGNRLCFNGKPAEDSAWKTYEINRSDGELIGSVGSFSNPVVEDEEGYIYTTGLIYDQDLNPVCEFHLPNTDSPGRGFSVANGNVYRNLWRGYGLEVCTINDLSDRTAARIKINTKDEGDFILRIDQEKILDTTVFNNSGAILSSKEINWSSSDENIAAVDVTGKVTAKSVGNTVIKAIINEGETEIKDEISLEVREIGVPVSLTLGYHVNGEKVIVNDLSGLSGEKMPTIEAFVEDKYGELVKKEPITWSSSEEGVIGMLLYKGQSGDQNIKYSASLSGGAPGDTVLTASLDNYPEIKASVNISISKAPYKRVWTIPFEESAGGSGFRRGSHVKLNDEKIVYSSENRVIMVSTEKPAELWRNDLGEKYGAKLGGIIVDEDKNIYVYDETSFNVFKVDSNNGEILWNYNGGMDIIEDVQVSSEFVYILTSDGTIKRLSQEGELDSDFTESAPENQGVYVNSDGRAFLAEKGEILELEDNDKKSIYKDNDYAQGSKLYIRDIDVDGNFIIQKTCFGKYSLISVNSSGVKNWIYEDVDRNFVVTSDEEGNLYVVDKTDQKEKNIYFLNNKGEEIAKNTIIDEYDEYYDKFVFEPIIGRNGIVYISLHDLHAVDKKTAKVEWSAKIRGAFSSNGINALSVDSKGTIYASIDNVGLVALEGRERTGIQLYVDGANELRLDAMKNLTIDVDNNFRAVKNLVLSLALLNQENKVISKTQIESEFEASSSKTFNLGAKVPKQGSFKINVNVKQKDSEDLFCNETFVIEE